MVKVDALAQLKDIHLPKAVGWWPLAPGWYALGLLLCIFVGFVIYFFYKQYLNSRAKKRALTLLTRYASQYEQDHNAQLASARISELLKRVALVYYPRAEVASLHGQNWIDFLTKTSKGIDFNKVRTLLLDAPFAPTHSVTLRASGGSSDAYPERMDPPLTRTMTSHKGKGCNSDHEQLPPFNHNRPLRKLAAVSEVREEAERRTGVYKQVHEDSSTASTKQFTTAVEFPKKSNDLMPLITSAKLWIQQRRGHVRTS